MFLLGLAIGLFLGTCFGIFVACLLRVSAGADHESCAGCPALECWDGE